MSDEYCDACSDRRVYQNDPYEGTGNGACPRCYRREMREVVVVHRPLPGIAVLLSDRAFVYMRWRRFVRKYLSVRRIEPCATTSPAGPYR